MRNITFIHGLPDSNKVWNCIINDLIKVYPNIQSLSLPGISKNSSILKPEISFFEIASLLIELLNDQSTILIGHDFGGLLSTIIAEKRPDLVEKLILVNSPTPYILRNLININLSQRQKVNYAFKVKDNPSKVISKNDYAFFKSFLFRDENITPLIYKEDVLDLWKDPMVQKNMGTYYRSILTTDFNSAKIKSDTLQIWSRKDPFYVDDIKLKMIEMYPDHLIKEINTESHWPYLSHSEEFKRAILKFIGDKH